VVSLVSAVSFEGFTDRSVCFLFTFVAIGNYVPLISQLLLVIKQHSWGQAAN